MANKNISKGASEHRESSAIGEVLTAKNEKVDYDVRFVIRAFPEDYPRIKDEIEDLLKRFD